ncbi:MAG: hypothetical protein ACRCZI_15350 [Cetobacterium sp.]
MIQLASVPIPALYYVAGRLNIPCVDSARVASMDRKSIDVTVHSSSCRQFAALDVTLRDATGRVLFCGMPDAVHIALTGGGEALVLNPNEVHDRPITMEQYEAELEREAGQEYDW